MNAAEPTKVEILWEWISSGIWRKMATEYDEGTILDPKTGKEYSCLMKLEGNDKLKVRGYIGVSILVEPNIGIG